MRALADTDDRYECILEPFDTWMVFDNRSETPAVLGDRVLMALGEAEAAELCRLLNLADGEAVCDVADGERRRRNG